MTKQNIHVALLGMGTVGSGVYEILMKRQAKHFKDKIGVQLTIKTIMVRNPDKYRDQIDEKITLTTSWQDIIEDDEIDIIVEVMGGIHPSYTYIKEAFQKGKHVVTANKDLMASHGEELHELAKAQKVDLYYEAAVMAAIPIIRPLKECLAGNDIEEIVGIMNGTTNYILSKMSSENWTFEEALKEATVLGYAEADPSADILGYDAARKAAILANIAFHSPVTFEDVTVEGITKITPQDINHANRLDAVIKLLGIASKKDDKIAVHVHPMLISKHHPLATVNDSYNAIFIRGDAVGDVMFFGRGAGKLPTASAVVGDVIDISRNILKNCTGRIGDYTYANYPILPMNRVDSRFYIRLEIEDNYGVLAKIAEIFAKNEISIAEVIQDQQTNGGRAELIIVTHNVLEHHIEQALEDIKEAHVIAKVENTIRVYGDI